LPGRINSVNNVWFQPPDLLPAADREPKEIPARSELSTWESAQPVRLLPIPLVRSPVEVWRNHVRFIAELRRTGRQSVSETTDSATKGGEFVSDE
jgi:hypothetical protein